MINFEMCSQMINFEMCNQIIHFEMCSWTEILCPRVLGMQEVSWVANNQHQLWPLEAEMGAVRGVEPCEIFQNL